MFFFKFSNFIIQILAGLYTPGDGYIDPYSLTQGIAAGARLHGATIMQKTEVTSLEQLSDGGWRVGTPRGAVDAETVINCSGNTVHSSCK